MCLIAGSLMGTGYAHACCKLWFKTHSELCLRLLGSTCCRRLKVHVIDNERVLPQFVYRSSITAGPLYMHV